MSASFLGETGSTGNKENRISLRTALLPSSRLQVSNRSLGACSPSPQLNAEQIDNLSFSQWPYFSYKTFTKSSTMPDLMQL